MQAQPSPLKPLVVRADSPPASGRYVVGGKVRYRDEAPTQEPPMIGQDLPAAEKAENAAVHIVRPESPGPKLVEANHDSHATVATPFGPALPIEMKSHRADVPAFAREYDMLRYGEQKFLYAFIPAYKSHVYVVPDRWVKRDDKGEILTGVDTEKMPPRNTFTTSDPNFHPPGARATDNIQDGILALGIVAVCIVAALGLKAKGWI